MNTVLNFRTDKKLKAEAQKVARDLDLPLANVMNNYLRQFVREKRVVFEVLEPNNKTIKELLKASADADKGINISPSFDNIDDAIVWLEA